VDPLDHVVACVHGIGIGRQDLNLETVDEPGRFEGIVPPPGPFQEGRAKRFRCAWIQVVDDGLNRLASLGRGIPLLHAMPSDVSLLKGLPKGRGVVHIVDAIEPGPGVGLTHLEGDFR